MLDLLILTLVLAIWIIGLIGAWIFATVLPRDVKDSNGNYLVKR